MDVEGGTTTNYIWDGWDLLREEKSGAVTETTDYLCPAGEVLAFKRDGDWYYLHGNGLSSTQLMTDASGAVVGRYVYGAWGDELVASESLPGVFENRFVGGLGCRRDSATGLVYMRHRWYDVQLQRFISRDPIGLAGGSNLYSYCGNQPQNSVDSEGLQPGGGTRTVPRPSSRRSSGSYSGVTQGMLQVPIPRPQRTMNPGGGSRTGGGRTGGGRRPRSSENNPTTIFQEPEPLPEGTGAPFPFPFPIPPAPPIIPPIRLKTTTDDCNDPNCQSMFFAAIQASALYGETFDDIRADFVSCNTHGVSGFRGNTQSWRDAASKHKG